MAHVLLHATCALSNQGLCCCYVCSVDVFCCGSPIGYQCVHAGCQCVYAGCQFSPTSLWCGLGPSVHTVLMLTGETLCQNTTSAFSTPSFYCRTLVGLLPLANNGQHSASSVYGRDTLNTRVYLHGNNV